jgi:hypothetical protein
MKNCKLIRNFRRSGFLLPDDVCVLKIARGENLEIRIAGYSPDNKPNNIPIKMINRNKEKF